MSSSAKVSDAILLRGIALMKILEARQRRPDIAIAMVRRSFRVAIGWIRAKALEALAKIHSAFRRVKWSAPTGT